MTLLILVTVMIAGLPAIGVTWLLMDEQLQLRVRSAQASTQAFYASEQRQILQLTQLISERPTLCNLLLHGDDQRLILYLNELRQNTPLDSLIIASAGGQSFVSGSNVLPLPNILIEQHSLPVVDIVALDEPPRIAIYAVSEIASDAGCVSGQAGRVIAIQVMDRDFMKKLAEDTGLEQSLIMGDHRVATSFTQSTALPLNPGAAIQVYHTSKACCTVGAIEDETYYVGLAPMKDNQGSVIALSELALPVNSISNIAVNMIVLLGGIGIFAALGGIGLALLFTRRITRPLGELSSAAEWIGAGDLETPVPVTSGWIEIDRLANQLEHSRRNLKYVQQITHRGLRHIAQILDETRHGIVVFNMDGAITWVNAEAGHILGYETYHLLGRHYSQIFRPAPSEVVTLEELLRIPLYLMQPKRLTILNAQNCPITVILFFSSLETEQHTTAQPSREIVLTLRDVSEEEAANRLRAEFLANLAHEFRTPLSAISATAELLVDEGQNMTPDELSHLANVINMSTIHLQMLVDNMLENAIIEAGIFRLRACPMQLQDLLRNVTEMVSPLLQRRQQHLEVDAPDGELNFMGDPGRLNQALINLLENASKFSPTGGTITVLASQQAEQLTFAVLDSGPGLPTERFGDLFNRYATGDHPRSAQYGIGMGLPIVKAIVEAHGGQVGAENRPEGGAKVWFILPLKQPGEEEESQ